MSSCLQALLKPHRHSQAALPMTQRRSLKNSRRSGYRRTRGLSGSTATAN